MKQFLKQLRILLWKNFTLRRRQIFRNVIEFLWPLAIFIILVSVRHKKPAENVPEEKRPIYFAPRALPSAGGLMFIQSFFCNYQVNEFHPEPQNLPTFTNSMFTKIIEDMYPLLQNQSQIENLMKLSTDLPQLLNDSMLLLNDLRKSVLPTSVLFGNTSVAWMISNLNITTQTAEAMTRSSIQVQSIMDLFEDASSFTISRNITAMQKQIEEKLCNGSSFSKILSLPEWADEAAVQSEMCSKINQKTLEKIALHVVSRRQEIEKNLPEVGNIVNLIEELFERYENVQSEIQNIPQFDQLIDKLVELISNVSKDISTGNMTNTEFLQFFVCGRNRNYKPSYMQQTSRQMFPNTTEEKIGKIPSEGGSSDSKCNKIAPANRTDCGWPGISENQCLNLNCCFDSSIERAKYCYCNTDNKSSCCHKRRLLLDVLSTVSGYSAPMIDFLTEILEGKIYYTPDNNRTREVISKLSIYVQSLVSEIDVIKEIAPTVSSLYKTSERFLQGRNLSADVQQLRELMAFVSMFKEYDNIPFIGQQLKQYEKEITDAQNFISNFTDQYGMYLNESYLSSYQRNRTARMIDSLIDSVKEFDGILDCFDLSSFFQGVSTEEELVKLAIAEDRQVNFLSSIVFMNIEEGKPLPKKIEYKLRYNPDYVPSTARIKTRYWKAGPGPWGSNSFWRYQYINFGFVFLQDLIERSLIEVISNKTVAEPGVFIQQFPYPCYIKDDFIAWLGNFMPLFMTLAWVYTIAMIVKSIVYEKELRLKEVMKVMGLENTVHWCAWFITSFIMMFLTIVALIMILKAGKIIIYSNPLVLIFVMCAYACASISMAFLISVFFSRANIAAACGGIIYFFTYLLYPITLWFEEQMDYTAKGFVSLFSTTAFGLSFKYISRWEEQGIGAQWSNFYKNPMPTDTFSLGTTVNFLVLDTLLYLFVMWYFEHVMPGQYGIPKKWYFLFTKEYWCPKKSKKIHVANDYNDLPDELNSSMTSEYFSEFKLKEDYQRKFEEEPKDLKPGISIQNLIKIYSNKKKAVNNLNLKFYEGHISALLGHNGAGKSTTISILTGLFPPTSGAVYVEGKSVETDIAGVRKSLGLCPQHNVLFDNLTVEEHMWFYGQLKGIDDSKKLEKEIEKFLCDVGLTKKKKELSMNLSGGMKRKLSVAMAFIADSRTVILDEPTSGVDPYSRRGIWDLILKYKKDRTILLSTHYMDEADLLGDRISIISEGVLQCSGTSLFLKRQFGKGYSLTITKDMDDTSGSFKHDEITKFISSFIPGGTLQDNFESELTYVMPSAARLTGEFSTLFENLEENLKEFGIKSYGISDTTLEEVFIKASNREEMLFDNSDQISMTGPAQARRSNMADDSISLASFASHQGLLPDDSFESIFLLLLFKVSIIGMFLIRVHIFSGLEEFANEKLLWGPLLWVWQFKALIIKRFHHARRSKKGFFSQILLPAIFVICAMGVSMIRPPRQVLPSLKLSTDMFGDPSYIVIDNINQDSFSNELFRSYIQNNKNKYFIHNNKTKYSGTSSTCSCSTGKQICNGYPAKPPSIKLDNKDIVFDVTGGNMNDYILQSTEQYIRKRHGGATFGEILYNLPDAMNSTEMPSLVSNIGTRQNVKVWFNHKTYHALPTFINMMNNAILRASIGKGTDHEIIAYNHPIDFNREQLDEQATYQGISDLFTSIFVITALAFVPASFLVYLVQDRISKSKHLQLVSGLNPVVYWLGNYAWDMINYLIPAFCITIIFLAFNQRAYVSSVNFPATMSLLLLYGWSMTPLMYPFSFLFDVPSTAYIVLICGNLFVGIIGTIATFILDFFGQDDMELYNINVVLKRVLLLFPNYSFGRGLMDLAGNQLQADIYERLGSSKFANPFKWDIIGRNVFAMIFTGILYFLITLLIQYRFFMKPLRSKISSPLKEREEDVKKEQDHILDERNDTDYIMKTKLLSKMYRNRIRNRKTLAVDRLSLGIKEGECFGLLGVNGAGKTSTFKMLTGDTSITFGDAFIKGHSVRTDLNTARQFMGYCPQFDALDELLTGKEMLTYYAQIRGMNHADGEKMANWAIETLGLSQYKDRPCGTYSGGNKRKLSTAIALLGSPPLIFLDEPTTGMDPVARRFLWNVVSSLIKSGKSVILTSHSMEECETLCTRLAIMVNGEFQCIGSPQHLRSKFGMGYTVIIRSKTGGVDLVHDFIEANFKNAKLKDRHHYMLEYQLPKENLLLSTVFYKLELLRKTGSIEDYSVTQTTLDQIFVNFARNQVESVTYKEENDTVGVKTHGELRMEDWPHGTSVVV